MRDGRGRLITVSNRLPVTLSIEDGRAKLKRLGAVPVQMDAQEIRVFYEEISNGVLWPICHDRIDRLPLRIEGWDTYERVNQRYADAVAAHWRPGDVVWVHDYQLLRVPGLLRQRIPDARVGFFLHVPFPNPEVFFTLSVRRWLIEGMLGADLIGFHTRRYRGHFTGALRRLFGLEMRTLELKQPGVRLLFGVDRLDYSKGIERRLLSFEQLLLRHPEWRGRVRLVQIAVPSRGQVGAYRRFRTDVEALVGRINGEFATPSWTPIHYIHRAVSPATLVALYRAADVMLVTPVRDGMNLVAKEFVACRSDEDGVLILSEFAGAADELRDARIVNPYDVDGVAEVIHQSLIEVGPDRRAHMRRLREQVFGHDVHRWAAEFVEALSPSANTQPITPVFSV